MQFGAMSQLNTSTGFSGSNPQTVATLAQEPAGDLPTQQSQPSHDVFLGAAIVGVSLLGLVGAFFARRK